MGLLPLTRRGKKEQMGPMDLSYKGLTPFWLRGSPTQHYLLKANIFVGNPLTTAANFDDG